MGEGEREYHVLSNHPGEVMGEPAEGASVALPPEEIEAYAALPAVVVYDGVDVVRKLAVSPAAPSLGEVEANLARRDPPPPRIRRQPLSTVHQSRKTSYDA